MLSSSKVLLAMYDTIIRPVAFQLIAAVLDRIARGTVVRGLMSELGKFCRGIGR